MALTGALVRVAPGRGWVVFPRQNRWNQRVVAQFGGIPILTAFWSTDLLLPAVRPQAALLFGTGVLALLGLVDDRRGLGPKPKLVIEVLLAAWLVHAGVIYALTPSSIANQLLTLLWIVGITNAFNLIDNMDGLAAGVAIIALAAIALLAGLNSPLAVLALLLMVSIGGFWLFNLHPARVFMGDVGSLPIGFFLACASVMAATRRPNPGADVFLPALLLVVPLFDVLLVSITRPLNGRAISDGARDHTSHRLVLLGMSEVGAVALLHGITFLGGLLAICWVKVSTPWVVGCLALFLVALIFFWLFLARLALPESWLSMVPGPLIRIPG
ncbi:MAG: undecaprenyl/decaprenyl-phosphate alpha-N-acetylglucosaminyl 1-phosphate transferase, partial [Acidobacteriia bacterium]|nr:undecaprenyl/decaprenyl-phosphate alpha-N-acetylglucosaminyl 1-phosphate transferase [Terriglobia bacterium]